MKMKIILAVVLSMTCMTPVTLTAQPADSDVEQDIERQNRELELARERMQEAAQRFAEVSAHHADRVIREVHVERVNAAPVRLGIVLATGGEHGVGVLVGEVGEGAPAAKAGLQGGDILLMIGGKSMAAGDGRPTHPVQRVREALMEAKAGDKVPVRYKRGRRTHNTTVEVEENPSPRGAIAFAYGEGAPRIFNIPQIPLLPDAPVMWRSRSYDGIELVKMSEGLGQYFGTEVGLLVVRTGEENPFKLQDGDVVLSIGGRVPESPVHAMRILRSYNPGEQVRLDVMRDRQRLTLEGTIPDRETERTRVIMRQ